MTSHHQQQQSSLDLQDAAPGPAVNSNNNNSNILERLLMSHGLLVRRQLLPFLSINDLTHLGMVSHQYRDLVISTRSSSSYPHIIWEERRPTQLRYDSWTFGWELGDTIGKVAQRQPFHFILRTAENVAIKVEYSLVNELWEEQENSRDVQTFGSQNCRDLSDFPLATWPFVSVFEPQNATTRAQRHLLTTSLIGDNDGTATDDDAWEIDIGNNRGWFVPRRGAFTPLVVEHFRDMMAILWLCAQRIAVYPDDETTVYPSAEYLMQRLPSWLHPYFPPPAVANIPNDREIVVEFEYRPAPSLAAWNELHFDERNIRTNLLDLPWYQNDEESDSEEDEDEVLNI